METPNEDLVMFTVEEFQNDFDNLMSRVESGEHIAITNGQNTAVMMPADEELLRIYTDHNEGP
jgi:prevent-host-death family protein